MSTKESKVWLRAKDTDARHEMSVEQAERLLKAFGRLWMLDDEQWEMREGVLRPVRTTAKKKK